MTCHRLRILPAWFDAVKVGIKTVEVRKDDRDYRVGDILHLMQYDPEKDRTTNKSVNVVVTHILRHDDLPQGIPEGFVVLSIKRWTE